MSEIHAKDGSVVTVGDNYEGIPTTGDDVVYVEILDWNDTAVVGLTTDEAIDLMAQLAEVVNKYIK